MSRFEHDKACFTGRALIRLINYVQGQGADLMGCDCSVKELVSHSAEVSESLNRTESIVQDNIRILREGAAQREVKYPHLRELFAPIELISTFSHLNINFPIDEVFGNHVLKGIAEGLNLDHEKILNIAYDNIHPGNDAPKGHKIQYVIVNPQVLDPGVVIHLQKALKYDPKAVEKNGQNRIKSVPEQNIDAFRHRYDQIDEVLTQNSGPGDVANRIVKVRRGYMELLSCDFIPEHSFSQRVTPMLADVLEKLYEMGFPFWEMPVPEHRDRYVEYTYLVEGVGPDGHRQPARFENGEFIFPFGENDKEIPQEKIFDALRNFEVIPTMPLVILTTATAPQLPHLGGGVWKGYASVHVDAQSEWLGINERSDTLILSTQGFKPLMAYRQNQDFTGFPAIYLTYGPDVICEALDNGAEHRVEFKRIVY